MLSFLYVYSDHSILECYNLFSGVELSMRSFFVINLEDCRPSNTSFMYYVTGPEYSMHFKPVTPQYKKLKNGMITSLTLKITDQNGNIITDGPGTTVVFHIQ